MPVVKELHAEPIPGYRLLAPLGRGGFGEVWKCEAPGGLFKAIKFVYGNLNGLALDSAHAEEELRAIQRIKAIRHPFLLSIDRVENVGGELLIVTELADRNLHELLDDYRKSGLAGIPRLELVLYLREAAEVLDLMNQQYQLQHLDVKPRNLFLVSNHVKVADFGLVTSLAGGSGGVSERIQPGAITPLYAAPELFLGRVSRQSDQYSLAIVYQELLTGRLPFPGKNSRQLLLQHTKIEPDLSSLSEHDRTVVGRALSKDPERRFPRCMDFVKALMGDVGPAHAPADSVTLLPTIVTSAVADGGAAAVETVHNKKGDTEKRRRANQEPPAELPGYQFQDCLGRSPLAEVWKVQAADGTQKLAKFLYGFSSRSGSTPQEKLARLQSLHHPALLPAEYRLLDPGRLLALADPIKETLRDRANQCQARKLAGIMRGELLSYLRAAAEALDYLYQQHSIQHLGLHPRSLGIDQGWLQIADFGLAQLLWIPAEQDVARQNARYAAPELFERSVSRSCDQYSLALVYCEMLTGVHPLRRLGLQASWVTRQGFKPELELLPESDKALVARALDADPGQRWPSCTAFTAALEGLPLESDAAEEHGDRFTALVTAPRRGTLLPPVTGENGDVHQHIRALVTEAGGQVPDDDALPPPILAEAGEVLRHRLTVGLPLGSARLKVDAFCQQWYGQMVRDDDKGCTVHLSLPANFWQQWIGRQPGLEIKVHLARVQPLSPTPIEVGVEIRAFRCSRHRGNQLLQEIGPNLLDSLQTHLLVNAEKRTQERLLWPRPVTIRPLDAQGRPGEPIACRGKDLSLSGIGFYLLEELETSEILVHLPAAGDRPAFSVSASLVRAKRCADGWYDVGALFRMPAVRKPIAELRVG